MMGMVPRDKMSRKNRRILDLAKRSVWERNPVSRVRESGKRYDRNRMKQAVYDD